MYDEQRGSSEEELDPEDFESIGKRLFRQKYDLATKFELQDPELEKEGRRVLKLKRAEHGKNSLEEMGRQAREQQTAWVRSLEDAGRGLLEAKIRANKAAAAAPLSINDIKRLS